MTEKNTPNYDDDTTYKPDNFTGLTEPSLEDRVVYLEQNGIPGVRDFFATSALSFLADKDSYKLTYSEVAKKAYHIADSMLLERSKGGTENPQ